LNNIFYGFVSDKLCVKYMYFINLLANALSWIS
jgi:hypothetical protein